MGKSGSETFCAPPQDRVKLFAPPLLKSGNFSMWLKLQGVILQKFPQLLQVELKSKLVHLKFFCVLSILDIMNH